MRFRVVKIEDEDRGNGKTRAMLEIVADACLDSAMNAIQHPSPDRTSSPALIYFNADEVLNGLADTEYYINDVAYSILVSSGLDLKVGQELKSAPKSYGIVFQSPYFST